MGVNVEYIESDETFCTRLPKRKFVGMADYICEQLGDKVRQAPCEKNGAVNDGKISKKKIKRYVERTRASDLKNLEDFDNDKDKFMKHIRLSDKEQGKKQKTEHAGMMVPVRAESSSIVQMVGQLFKAQAESTRQMSQMMDAMQKANVEAAKVSAESAKVNAESMGKLVVLLAEKSGVTGKVERAPKKVKLDSGGKGAQGGKSAKVLKAEAKAAFEKAQSDWDEKAKGEQKEALGQSGTLSVSDMVLKTKNNGMLHDVFDQMNATWREKLGGGDGMAIIENTPEHVRSVADFNQR